MLPDVFHSSGLAGEETLGDALGGTVRRAWSPKNPLDAIVERKEYRPVQGTCFGDLRIVTGTRFTSEPFRQLDKVPEIEAGMGKDALDWHVMSQPFSYGGRNGLIRMKRVRKRGR